MVTSIVLIAITSTFVGLFIAVSVSEVFEAQTFSNFFRFPMMFLCGLFIPIRTLPAFIRPLPFILPLTYGVDILKTSINADGFIYPGLSLVVLLAFCLGLFLTSIHNIKSKWIY
ncbi:MAG: ABC transporter permease [Firmicutes bacterium]|nr:ABC transporter permease [Bacillota bacterium]